MIGLAADLSRYRNFKLGADLSSVAKQTGTSPSQAKAIQLRPALIQELEWRPQPIGSSVKPEAAQEIVFTFLDGKLFRIVVNYDRYETEGLTANDMIEAISGSYGVATRPPTQDKTAHEEFREQEDVIAGWSDKEVRFELIRSSYGPSYKLTGVLIRLEALAQAAIVEAARLDEQEAPQRNAARLAGENETERIKLEKARTVNKPRFRP
jgi:hypothetical protein